ncbi:hypothetical protein H4582DRAFT_2200538 [Lactarius indigo]|nr:hypothetical protein H4582DRAFT_2200538 [Lactarius indigo]
MYFCAVVRAGSRTETDSRDTTYRAPRRCLRLCAARRTACQALHLKISRVQTESAVTQRRQHRARRAGRNRGWSGRIGPWRSRQSRRVMPLAVRSLHRDRASVCEAVREAETVQLPRFGKRVDKALFSGERPAARAASFVLARSMGTLETGRRRADCRGSGSGKLRLCCLRTYGYAVTRSIATISRPSSRKYSPHGFSFPGSHSSLLAPAAPGPPRLRLVIAPDPGAATEGEGSMEVALRKESNSLGPPLAIQENIMATSDLPSQLPPSPTPVFECQEYKDILRLGQMLLSEPIRYSENTCERQEAVTFGGADVQSQGNWQSARGQMNVGGWETVLVVSRRRGERD